MLNEARDRVRCSGSINPQYALELEGIEVSLANLMSFPFVARAVESGELAIHGAWFAIHHGELHWRNKAIPPQQISLPPPRSPPLSLF